jgi:hypothetical protein
VTALPPALAPWAAQLAPFAPELAVSLGGWARRIAAAVGPLPGRRAGEGEPDGVSGLARRGPYERLLLSEWLLAEELPDEFVRRAAAGEHLFVERGRRAHAAARRSVALLDAGPDQLGAPRIAQLAALVVLAARAEAARVEFAWGIAQAPALGLVGGFSADLARGLLLSRTGEPPGEDALAAWRERLPPPAERDDLWLVGGPALLRAHGLEGASRLLVEDVPDPDARQVRLVLGSRLSGRREVVLDLPPEPDCVRLVRDPFGVAVQAPARLPGAPIPEAGIVFHPRGHRLALRLEDGDLLEVPVPSSPRQKVGRARVVRGGEGVIGVCWPRKRLTPARVEDPNMVEIEGLVHVKGRGDLPAPRCPDARERLRPCFAWPPKAHRALLVDAASVLYDIHPPTGALVATVPADLGAGGARVVALLAAGAAAAYVLRAGDGRLALVLHAPTGAEWAFEAGRGTGATFLDRRGDQLLLATQDVDGGTWTVRRTALAAPAHAPTGERQLRPPDGTTVVGVVGDATSPALVLLEADRRRFSLLYQSGLDTLCEARAEVASAEVSASRNAVAWLTRAGALAVWSIAPRALLLDLHPGEHAR